jgi:uncharacterized protein
VPKELSPNNKGECWINTGLGAEGIITDAMAGDICRNAIIPQLRNKAYAAAIAAGLGSIEYRLRGGTGATASQAPPAPRQPAPADPRRRGRPINFNAPWLYIVLGGIVWFVGGGFAILAILQWRRNRPRQCPKCGKKMRRLDEQTDDAKLDPGQALEEKLGSMDYDVWQCECGEATVIPYGAFAPKYSKCPKCGYKTVSNEREIILSATTVSAGIEERRFHCAACQAKWSDRVAIPIIVPYSSSSGSSSSGGSSGGGGGSSFGGSGSSSGGGGGSSY